MSKLLVVIVGVVAWLICLGVCVWGRATVWRPRERPDYGSWRQRLAGRVGGVAGAAAGAFVAGMLAVGLGGRLLMRILAATSPGSSQGQLTEADEIVGEVTLGGTIGLVIFVGLLAGLGGLVLFAALRRWLPKRSVWAGIVTAGIGAGLFARPSGLLDPDNHDFTILEPTWLAVILALVLTVTFAISGAILMDRWTPSWPTPGRSARGWLGLVALVPLLAVPPVALGLVVVLAVATIIGPKLQTSRVIASLDRVLPRVTLAGGVAGASWVGLSCAQILG